MIEVKPGELIKVIDLAKAKKPAMNQPCNHCGWCCMAEVCPTGQSLTGSSEIPCRLLVEQDGNYLCTLALASQEDKEAIHADTFCDARTQEEVIKDLLRK